MLFRSFIGGRAAPALLLTLAATSPSFATAGESVLATLSESTGGMPLAGLIADSSGNLYGTVSAGGNNGQGAVFELIPQDGNGKTGWAYKRIYSLTGRRDGATPESTLAIDGQGHLYGTASQGGTHGYGAVFELSQSNGHWRLARTYDFKGGADGGHPFAGVTLDAAGNVYGSTYEGAANQGSVFELQPAGSGWKETTLRTFRDHDDPWYLWGSVVLDAAGNVYGTGYAGPGGYGAVFELTKRGGRWKEIILHHFQGDADGGNPAGPLTFDGHGNLYGTASSGSGNPGSYWGQVFELSPTRKKSAPWNFSTVYAFASDGPDGATPFGGVVFDSEGRLYGTAGAGGNFSNPGVCNERGCGVVFELLPKKRGPWTERVLWTFTGYVDGGIPVGNLLLDNSQIYGATYDGGAGYGVLFSVPQPK